MKSLLLPLEWGYLSGVKLHRWLYSTGTLRTRTLTKPVVSVGNLTTGGTGKTPTVIALGRMLLDYGYSISVLLRGYKGAHKGRVLLVSDGRKILANPEMAGDEALVIARNLPQAVVAVGRNRAEVGKQIEETFGIELHLLDDGFQHLQLSRTFDLLLIDTTNPFGGGHLLPVGRLREPLPGAARADAMVLTRTHQGDDYAFLLKRLKVINSQIPCFKARQKLVFENETTLNVPNSNVSLIGMRVMAFAGIANPTQFFDSLHAQRVEVASRLTFQDHHRYSAKDLELIKNKCRLADVEVVVTTEKDRENLGGLSLEPLRLVVARVVFGFDEPMRLLDLIRSRIGPKTDSRR